MRRFSCIVAGMIFLVVGVGCTPSQFKPGLMAKWSKKLNIDHEAARRFPAESAYSEDGKLECLKDRVQLKFLKDDIASEERRRRGNPLKMVWHGMDFSSLPLTQSQFLLNAGNRLLIKDTQLSKCKDAMCAINGAYLADSNSPAGALVYWWYLKTGYYLNVSGDLVTVIDKKNARGVVETRLLHLTFTGAAPQEYFFNEAELKAFWVLTQSLPNTFWNSPLAPTIYRFPPRGDFPTEDPNDESLKNTCGMAIHFRDRNYMNLLDACLKIDGSPTDAKGQFFISVIHEFGHFIDYSREDYSLKPEWLALSGWIQTPDTEKKNGVVQVKWTSDPAKEKMVNTYAGTKPREDWAESVAYFRFNGDTLKNASVAKFKLISQKIYHDRVYDSEGLYLYYLDQIALRLKSNLPGILDGCTRGDPPKGLADDDLEINLQGFDFLSVAESDCVRRSTAHALTVAVRELKRTDWDACGYFVDGADHVVAQEVADIVKPIILDLAKDRKQLQPRILALKKFHQDLAMQLDPRDFYRQCAVLPSGQPAGPTVTPQDCYLAKLAKRFLELAEPYRADAGEQMQVELESYLKENNFDAIAGQILALFKMIFAGADPWLEQAAEQRWKSCQDVKPLADPTQALFLPFTGRSTLAKAEVLDCINHGSNDDLSSVRKRLGERVGVTEFDQNSIEMIHGLFLPAYLATLQNHLDNTSAH